MTRGEARRRSESPRSDGLLTQRDRRQATIAETDEQIRDAERRKANLEKPPGKAPDDIYSRPGSKDLKCDEKLFELASHIRDEALIASIERGEYVELPRLYPKDRIPDDEGRINIVYKEGKLEGVPSENKEMVRITSFERWLVAFEVYAGIYTRRNPRRAPEIFQYIYKIRKGAEVYHWHNVYSYDKIFRTHMGKNPGRDWGSALRDTWDNHVRETQLKTETASPVVSSLSPRDQRKKKGFCWKFNKSGYCSSGSNCEWDHRCSVCGLPNHGKYNCRKREGRYRDKEPRSKPGSSRK